VLLLAHTDTLHGTLSGLATKKLLERAYGIFGDARYVRLATLSVAHLYNLRQRTSYQQQRQVCTKTRPASFKSFKGLSAWKDRMWARESCTSTKPEFQPNRQALRLSLHAHGAVTGPNDDCRS
jgi:hypothetical protein